jgi:hypothetical protein
MAMPLQRKYLWFWKILPLIGLGAGIFMIICNLPCCGFNDSPMGPASKKNDKAKASPTELSLLEGGPPQNHKEGGIQKELEKLGIVQGKIDPKFLEALSANKTGVIMEPPQVIKEALAREENDPNIEVFPGLTLRQLNAMRGVGSGEKLDDHTVIFPPMKSGEPGVTLGQLNEMKSVTAREKINPQTEIFKGITWEQLNAINKSRMEIDPKDLEQIPPLPVGNR